MNKRGLRLYYAGILITRVLFVYNYKNVATGLFHLERIGRYQYQILETLKALSTIRLLYYVQIVQTESYTRESARRRSAINPLRRRLE